LIEVRLQRGLLGTLLLYLSVSLGALVFYLLRLLIALIFDLLLASVLLHREDEADDDESERDDEQLQPVSDCHPTEARPARPGYPTFSRWLHLPAWLFSSHRVFLVPHVPAPS
jgi:hypothetical protein